MLVLHTNRRPTLASKNFLLSKYSAIFITAIFCLAQFYLVPAHAWVIDQTGSVTFKGADIYGTSYKNIEIPIINFSDSIPIGAIGCLGICAGLEAEAGGHAYVDANFSVGMKNSIDLISKADTRTFIFGDGSAPPELGSSFHLINRIDSQGIQKLNLNAGEFSGSVNLDINIGGFARAEACFIGCVEGKLSLNVPVTLNVASVNKNGLYLFSEKVDDLAPFSYTDPNGLYGGSASLPNFSKSFHNLAPGQSATLPATQRQLLYGWMDVAEVIAKAAGFPIPLEGSMLGFSYELLSLDLFAGMNLQHSFKLNPKELQTAYQFSAPVQIFDTTSNSWGAPTEWLYLEDYEYAQIRSENAASLGITPHYVFDYAIDWDFDLILNAGAELDALALKGYGINLGPLLDPDPWKVHLKKFNLDSGTDTGRFIQKGNAFTLDFTPIKIIPGDPGGPVTEVNLCDTLPGGCGHTGYVAIRTPLGNGIIEETVWRVLNYGVAGCNAFELTDCDLDFSTLPQISQYRVNNFPNAMPLGIDLDEFADDPLLLAVLEELGIDPNSTLPLAQLLEFADNFDAISRLLEEAPLVEGPASDDDELLAALTALGLDLNNPFPQGSLGPGAPKLTQPLTDSQSFSLHFIPEPPACLLLLIGLLAFAGRYRSPHTQKL